MPTYCAAYNCKNYIDKKSGLSAHKFPKDPELRQRWIIATKRKGFNPSSTSCLCSVHFEESAFETGGLRRRLIKDAVPTLFQFTPHLMTGPLKRRKLIKRITKESPQDCEVSLRNSDSPDLKTPKIEIQEDEDEWRLQAQVKEELMENEEWMLNPIVQVKMEPEEKEEELEPVAFVSVPSLSEELFEEEC